MTTKSSASATSVRRQAATCLEGLEFLSAMTAGDRDRLLAAAEDVVLERGEVLLEQGWRADSLWVISEGVLEVSTSADAATSIARLGPGNLVGELSFVLDRRASATVTAVERTMALRIRRESLAELLAADDGFAAAFWRAVAVVVSARLAETTAAWGRVSRSTTAECDLSPSLEAALAAFRERVARLDEASVTVVSETEAEADEFLALLLEELRAALGGPEPDQALLRHLQKELVPTFLLSALGRRIWDKPRGYAGDWETIEMIYRNEAAGVGRVGQALDSALLWNAPGRAVRNRRKLLAGQIEAAGVDRPAAVTSLACGPAREVFDVLDAAPERLGEVNVLDIDTTAIDMVRTEATSRGVVDRFGFHQANLIKLALGREELHLADQDLVYSIGLIDYFPDDLVVALLNLIHPWLRSGGRVILGNFHPSNPALGWFELLEWRLIHRDEEDMGRLFSASVFGGPCDDILWEDEHINLFAVGVKG